MWSFLTASYALVLSLETRMIAETPTMTIHLPEPPKNFIEIAAVATVIVIAMWRRPG